MQRLHSTIAACLIAAGGLAGPAAQAAEIAISCGAVGQELELCREGVRAWEEETGHEVEIVSTPNSATERLALYQQILAAGSQDIDVYQIDVIWPGILQSHFIDLAEYAGDAPAAHFPAIVENNTVEGRLIAMPWFTDAGVLYYREDLLEKHGEPVPETWAQLTATARRIQEAERAAGNERLHGFVFQGRAYEGLTCNALEWVAGFGGGRIVEADGEISINNPQAVAALDAASGWVGEIAPEGVLNYAEEEARGVFQAGNAVFMRNWPYAWALAQSEDSPIRDRVGVTVLPRGGDAGRHVGVLGGWQLAVSRYSEHPSVAADLVLFLTSYEEQKRRAVEGSYNPTIPELYEDQEVLAAVPFFGELRAVFENAIPRPSSVTGAQYNRVSSEFYNAVHDVLSGEQPAQAALAGLERRLLRISRGGRW